MPDTLEEWSDQHWDRSFARQSSQADTVKLLVTFSLAIAATLVATALQVTPQNGLDMAAAVVLGASFLFTVGAIILDRLKWPNREKVLRKQRDEGWSEARLLRYLRELARDTEEENEIVVRRMKRVAEYQVVLSGGAGVLAVLSLFQRAA